MRQMGDFTPGKTVRVFFNTRDADGDPVTLAGSPAVGVYKDGGTTESTAGVTLTADFDSRTGCHLVAVDTSADGTFYSAGSEFHVMITAGTVDAKSVVGVVVGAFSLSNRSALRPTVADRTLDVSAGGEAGVDWSNVGSPTTTLNLSGTTVKTASDVEADTQDIQSRLPAALVGGRMDSSVGAMAANTLTASALASDAVTEVQSGLSTLTAGDVSAAVWNAATASYGAAGSYGALVEANLDAAVSSRLAAAGYTAPDNASIAAILADTGTDGVVVASGSKAGYSLAAAGLDAVLVDGKTLPAALQVIAALCAGKVSGAGTGTEVFKGLDGATTRATVTVDASGNRTAVAYG